MQRKFQIINEDENLDEETKTNLREKISKEFDLEREDDIDTQSKEKIEIQDTRSKFTSAVARVVGEKKQFLSLVNIFFSYTNMNLL